MTGAEFAAMPDEQLLAELDEIGVVPASPRRTRSAS